MGQWRLESGALTVTGGGGEVEQKDGPNVAESLARVALR